MAAAEEVYNYGDEVSFSSANTWIDIPSTGRAILLEYAHVVCSAPPGQQFTVMLPSMERPNRPVKERPGRDKLPLMNRRSAVVVVTVLAACALVAAQSERTALEFYQDGSRAFVEQRYAAAIDALTRSLAVEPKQLGAVRLLGLSYQLTGELDRAEAQFQAAANLAPKDAEAWFYLGRLYYVRNYFDKADAALQTAAKYSPNDVRIRECLALTEEALGDWTAAEADYRQAMRAVPKPPATLLLNYGAMLLKLNRAAESEPLLAKAAALTPSFWQARFELAKLYCQTGRFESALRELEAALRASPNPEEEARTHGLMAVAYSRLGRPEEARLAAAAAEK